MDPAAQENEPRVDASDFAAFAANRYEIWVQLNHAAVHHRSLGNGVIDAVYNRPLYVPLLSITLGSGRPTIFNSDAFASGAFVSVVIPRSILGAFNAWRADAIRDREADQAALERARPFRELAEKYNVVPKESWSPVLFRILQTIEAREELQNAEIEWLRQQQLFRVLATYYYRRFLMNADPWRLVMACHYLRSADQSPRAVELASSYLESHSHDQSKALAALLTTRGAAFRDLQKRSAAANDAESAIGISPDTPHPYNLLGAVCYDNGEYVKGDEQFDMALARGAEERDRDRDIRSAFRNATPVDRARMAEHLLAKDPKKYDWAARTITRDET